MPTAPLPVGETYLAALRGGDSFRDEVRSTVEYGNLPSPQVHARRPRTSNRAEAREIRAEAAAFPRDGGSIVSCSGKGLRQAVSGPGGPR